MSIAILADLGLFVFCAFDHRFGWSAVPLGGVVADEPYLNKGGKVPTVGDIRRALRVYAGACALVFVSAFVVSLFLR